tara:strand:- start:3229 stop:4566 length:1338 start_codon:yes stop_codon:yes gene_type:complete
MKTIIFSFLLSFLTLSQTFASDFIGADISYKHITNNTYEIKLTTYVVNTGFPIIRNFLDVDYSNSCTSGSIRIPRDTSYPSNISCSLIDPHLIIEYKTQFTFPLNNCNSYVLDFNGPCCSPIYNNIQTPSPLDELTSEVPSLTSQNTSATFNSSIIRFAQINSTTDLDVSVSDVNGDSIAYRLEDASGSYPSGYSATDPFGPNGISILNGSTGVLRVTPNAIGKYLVNVTATEYNNGIKVGKVQREWAIEVISNLATNNLPNLSGINNSNNYTLNACIGDTIAFSAQITDPDTNQIVTAVLTNPILQSKIITTGRTVLFKWIVDSSFGSGIYRPVILLNDGNCGVTSKSFSINIDSCITTSLSKHQRNRFKFFPNPTKGELSITLTNETEASQITIRSFTGQVVSEIYPIGKAVNIDLSSNPPGIYFISVQSRNSITTKKVILTK